MSPLRGKRSDLAPCRFVLGGVWEVWEVWKHFLYYRAHVGTRWPHVGTKSETKTSRNNKGAIGTGKVAEIASCLPAGGL